MMNQADTDELIQRLQMLESLLTDPRPRGTVRDAIAEIEGLRTALAKIADRDSNWGPLQMEQTSPAVLGPVEPTVRPCMVAKLRKADADVRRAFGTTAGTLYAQAAEELERWRWLKEDATAEQWERASHALDSDAEIDTMRRGA